MKCEVEKLKDFVTRNETYISSATWLTKRINNVSRDLDIYMESGELPENCPSIENLITYANQLDRRCSIEDKVLDKLMAEQKEFLL